MSDSSGVQSSSFRPPQVAGRFRGQHGGPGSADFKAAFSSAAQAAGVDASKVDDLQKQVDAAVQEARKGSGTGNPRQAVEAAVKNVLTSNGIDAEKFQTALKASLDQARGARGQASSTGQAAQPGQVGRFGQPSRRKDNDGDADDGPGASAASSDRGIDVAG